MAKHKPTFLQGSWKLSRDQDQWAIVQENGSPICLLITNGRSDAVLNRIACIICSTPELLELTNLCLRELYDQMDVLCDERREQLFESNDTGLLDYQIERLRRKIDRCSSVIGYAERADALASASNTSPVDLPLFKEG